jgi:hypothetical protein
MLDIYKVYSFDTKTVFKNLQQLKTVLVFDFYKLLTIRMQTGRCGQNTFPHYERYRLCCINIDIKDGCHNVNVHRN